MEHLYHDLGQLRGGEIVQVHLNAAANVLLLNSSNYNNYKRGRRYNGYGGHATQTPVRLNVPNAGRWYVAIDLGGYSGRVNSSVEILPGRMQPIRHAPLSSVPSLVQEEDRPDSQPEKREYDVFVSHASEDKDEVVRPLAIALQNAGLRVWYDEFELKIGSSLRQNIDMGLANSRFGIVVLSESFFGKGWPNYELDGLVTKAVSGDQIILPVWHKVSKQEVMSYSPSLADKVARSTSTHTVDDIAVEIASVISGD